MAPVRRSGQKDWRKLNNAMLQTAAVLFFSGHRTVLSDRKLKVLYPSLLIHQLWMPTTSSPTLKTMNSSFKERKKKKGTSTNHFKMCCCTESFYPHLTKLRLKFTVYINEVHKVFFCKKCLRIIIIKTKQLEALRSTWAKIKYT